MNKVINFGSLNIDHVYLVPHIVTSGETLSSKKYHLFCGGKGGNQSIALARAGAIVHHAGCVGTDGNMLIENLHKAGVNIDHITKTSTPTGHAIIQIDCDGENSIVLFPGANHEITSEKIDAVINDASPGDIMLLQNEINNIDLIMEKAKDAEMDICFNFAPFDQEMARKLPLHLLKFLIVNETEAEGLSGRKEPKMIIDELSKRYPETIIILTLGSKGAICAHGNLRFEADSPVVNAVDTTCAGDTFIGYFIDAYLNNEALELCLKKACFAAAIAVCHPGASNSIPYRDEISYNI